MILACLAYKGGVGKTTVATAIAHVVAVESREPVLLADADPQGSSFGWSERAQEAGYPLACATVALPSSNLRGRLAALGTDRYLFTVIDTPPGSGPIVASALHVATFAILPTKPTTADLERLWATWDAVQKARVPSLVVLTMARLGTRSLEAAREALTSGGASVAKAVFPMRESIAQAFGAVPSGILATAARDLLTEVFAVAEVDR